MNTEKPNTPTEEIGSEEYAEIASLLGSPGEETEEAGEEEAGEQPDAEESEESEDDATEEDAEAEDEQPAAATLETVEVDGKTYKIPSDLKPYILRQQDYTKKTQRVAEQQRQVESAHQQAQQQIAQYTQGLQFLGQALHQTLPQPPPASLRDDDPIEYVRQKEIWQEHAQRLQAVQTEQQRLAYAQQQENDRYSAEHLQREATRLPELIPAWKDDKRRKSDAAAIKQLLRERGYSDERITAISTQSSADEIAILQEWASLKALFAKRADAKPIPSKTVAPGAAKTTGKTIDRAKTMNRLKQSGSLDDFAAAYQFIE